MKNVMITGATSGIGEALLDKYHASDHHIIACGRNKTKLKLLHQQNSHVETLVFDVTNAHEIAAAAQNVAAIDILILNAGDCVYIDDARAFDGDAFADIININLISVGYLLQYFLPKLSRGGQIVFVSSSATLLPFSRAQAYGASKAGIDYLANSMRIDLAVHDFGVTLVHPGFVKTPLTDKNTFNMPFMVTSQQAAAIIYQGVAKRKNYVHFPKRLTILLKVLAFLPNQFWAWLATRKVES
jgi:NAD(P)-dependent dehydrogenase (short-subunit alcohol dehydrogenase family)